MFDTALIESGRSSASPGRKKSLPVAIGLHVATIAAVVGATVWSTGEPPEAEQPVVFVFPVGGPPPPPPGKRDGLPAPPAHSATDRHAAAPPIRLPPTTATEIASDPRPSELNLSTTDTDGSDAKGDRDGIAGGTGELPGDGERGGLPIGGAGPIMIDSRVEPPRLVTRVEPDYPESMRRGRIEGVVIVEAIISADGEMQSVQVLKSVNPILDRAVADAVRRWRYTPATLNGRRVSVFLSVTVRFGLDA